MKDSVFPVFPFYALALLLSAVFFLSCSTQVNGTIRRGGSAELKVRAALEPKMNALLMKISLVLGNGKAPDDIVLDGHGIGLSLAAAPGIASASFRNISPVVIEGAVAVSRIDQFLASAESREAPFIIYEEAAPGGSGVSGGQGSGGRLKISLDRSAAARIIPLISPDVADYLSGIFAPVVTGDVLSKEEYLSLVSSFYGKDIAAEIAAARIRLSLELPGPVVFVRGGTSSGNRVEFDAALTDILVLERPVDYEVSWK
jgi:hypothetical protein